MASQRVPTTGEPTETSPLLGTDTSVAEVTVNVEAGPSTTRSRLGRTSPSGFQDDLEAGRSAIHSASDPGSPDIVLPGDASPAAASPEHQSRPSSAIQRLIESTPRDPTDAEDFTQIISWSRSALDTILQNTQGSGNAAITSFLENIDVMRKANDALLFHSKTTFFNTHGTNESIKQNLIVYEAKLKTIIAKATHELETAVTQYTASLEANSEDPQGLSHKLVQDTLNALKPLDKELQDKLAETNKRNYQSYKQWFTSVGQSMTMFSIILSVISLSLAVYAVRVNRDPK